MINLTASIVVYNENKDTLKNVIEDFLSIKYEKELIVFDNSPVDTLRNVCEDYNNVMYIFSGKNIGFGTGHNRAFKKFTIISDIHLILNPDIYFNNVDIENFLNWFIQNSDISLAIPKVLNPDKTIQKVVRNIPTIINLFKRKFTYRDDTIDIHNNTISEIPFAHGCFFAFKTEVYKELGGFDERFFMYMEDVDIWIRAKKYGKTVINTYNTIYHQWARESSKNNKLLLWHIYSAIKFFWKYR